MRRVAMLLGGVVLGASASAVTLEDVLNRLERAESEIKSLAFDYKQTASLSVGKTETTISGKVSFQRPDRFRIETHGSTPQTVVSDGTSLWIHTPAHKQVIKDSLKGLLGASGVPPGLGSFQWRVADIKKEFDVALEDPTTDRPVLVLTPKGSTASTTVRLWIDMGRGVALKTALSGDTVKTEVTIDNVRVNPRLSKSLFQFKPPAGTDVMDMPTVTP